MGSKKGYKTSKGKQHPSDHFQCCPHQRRKGVAGETGYSRQDFGFVTVQGHPVEVPVRLGGKHQTKTVSGLFQKGLEASSRALSSGGNVEAVLQVGEAGAENGMLQQKQQLEDEAFDIAVKSTLPQHFSTGSSGSRG